MSGRPRVKRHRVGVNIGQNLVHLANFYPTLTLTVAEAVQNATDAGAKAIFVGVDTRRRTVIVLDDGSGATEAQFMEVLQSVCKGIKPPGSIGRFGIGLWSPLNRCTSYTFASQPDGPQGAPEVANVWTFNCAAIKATEKDLDIECVEQSALPPIPRQFVGPAGECSATWRTMLQLNEVTTERMVGTVDFGDLERQIRKFETALRANGTVVYLVSLDTKGEVLQRRKVEAEDFTGEPLAVFTHKGEACGTVTFALLRARKVAGQRGGKVRFRRTGDPAHIPWDDFYKQANGRQRSKNVKEAFDENGLKQAFDALRSGYFEGTISADGIELDPRRNVFLMGDALNGLYVAILAWYIKRGKALYEDEHELRREQRYEALAQQSLARVLEKFGTSSTFAAMAHRLFGVLPVGAASDDEGQPDKPDRPERQKRRPQQESQDPRPKRKRIVVRPPRRDPAATPYLRPTLQFAYELLGANEHLWEFDAESGVLTFNILHPIWRKVDETDGKHTPRNDNMVMALQEWLVFELLTIMTHHEEPGFSFESAHRWLDDEKVDGYVDLFVKTSD